MPVSQKASHREIVVATGNTDKLVEIKELYSDLPVLLTSLRDYWNPIPVIEEDGATFYENASIKADWTWKHASKWALAEDSGLVVDALDGEPGVRSARFAGIQCDTSANNSKLLEMMRGIAEPLRTARFICCVVVRIDQNTLLSAEGRCEGRIINTPRGAAGFGYDPLFVPNGFDKTFAELSHEDKNRISHRGHALRILKERLHDFIA